MSSTRPRRRASWAAATNYRAEPAGGTEATGYGAATIPTAAEWNWQIGYLADWASYTDLTRHRDLADTSRVQRITTSALQFTVGGSLSQRPAGGGVYLADGVRLDASDTSATAPVYNFTANATNYVWLKEPADTVRANYADREITTIFAAPAAGYVHVRTVTTGPLVVLSDTEPGTVDAAFTWGEHPQAWIGLADFVPSSGAYAVRMVPPAAALACLVMEAPGGYTAPMIDLTTEAQGVGLASAPWGSGGTLGAGHRANLDSYGAALYGTTSNPFAAGCCTVYSELFGTGFDVAIAPAPTPPAAPVFGEPLYGKLCMFAEAQTSGGGMRWREPVAGEIRIPFASRDGAVYGQTIGATTGLLAASAVTTLVTSASYTFRQGHTYLIIAQAETDWTNSPAFSITVDVRVNGVSVAPAPHAVNPCTISGPNIVRPWLNGTYYYYHSGADVSATVTLRTTHGAAGAGNVRYNNPRLTVLGAFAG